MHYSFWPSSWNHLIIVPVLKPGKDPLVAASYRPIHLISVCGKVLAQLIEKRLREYVPRSPEQMGFNPGHGTRDNVFVLSSIFDSYKYRGLYCAFVDFKGAFDSVDRSLLLKKLRSKGKVDERTLRIVAAMYSNVSASVKHSVHSFHENVGVKQGDPLGPRLFNIYIDDLPDFLFATEIDPQDLDGIYLNHALIRCLLYADDLVLSSFSSVGLQRQLDRLLSYCQKW
jgi:hypothetical protein